MTGVRVLTAVVLAPAVAAAVWWAPLWVVAALVALVIALSLQEFFAIGEKAGLRGYLAGTAICALGLAMVQYEQAGAQSLSLFGMTVLKSGAPSYVTVENLLLGSVLGLAVLAAASRRPVSEALGGVSLSAAGLLVVALPLSYLIRVQGAENGRLWTLFTVCLIWAGDSLAYFVGRSFGRLKMAPQISPNKTWEGALGNVAGSLLVAGVFARWLDAPLGQLLGVAAVANLAGQAGDLLESAYKRSAGVKDSGAVLPGHGGMLDRIDALIFATPVVWVYVTYVIAL